MKIEINRDYREKGTVAPVYKQYPGQYEPQDAYIAVTENGYVYADYSGEIGNAVPVDVWNNRTLRYPISPLTTIKGFDDLFEELEPVISEMMDHFSIEWDGSNQVGVLDDRGAELSNKVESTIILKEPEIEHQAWILTEGADLFFDFHDAVKEYRDAPDRDAWVREQIDMALANTNGPLAMESPNLEAGVTEELDNALEELITEEGEAE